MKPSTILTIMTAFLLVGMSGCIEKASGDQVAYVTAVEEKGLIWPSGTLYVKYKPENVHDEEGVHQYCVDAKASNYDELMADFKELAGTGTKIVLHYRDEMFVAPTRCNGEPYIVTGYTVVTSSLRSLRSPANIFDVG